MKRKMMNLRMVVILIAIMAFASPAVASDIFDIHTAWAELYDWVGNTNFSCVSCHALGEPVCDPLLGLYGCDVVNEFAEVDDCYKALMNVESLDSDEDGYNNITEIVDLTYAGNAGSHPDSTINIIAADYDAQRRKLVIRATSDYGEDAGLEVVDFGLMRWLKKDGYWQLIVTNVQTPPRYVTVCGVMEDCISDVAQ